jgi:hypothetical protein
MIEKIYADTFGKGLDPFTSSLRATFINNPKGHPALKDTASTKWALVGEAPGFFAIFGHLRKIIGLNEISK